MVLAIGKRVGVGLWIWYEESARSEVSVRGAEGGVGGIQAFCEGARDRPRRLAKDGAGKTNSVAGFREGKASGDGMKG